MPTARSWFLSKYKNEVNKVYTSKFYTPSESWPKKNVWWLQIPPNAIDMSIYSHVNLVCQQDPGKNDFHYLKVPTSFFNKHLAKFHRISEKISIYLSADTASLFVEIRGEGKLDFSQFLVNK